MSLVASIFNGDPAWASFTVPESSCLNPLFSLQLNAEVGFKNRSASMRSMHPSLPSLAVISSRRELLVHHGAVAPSSSAFLISAIPLHAIATIAAPSLVPASNRGHTANTRLPALCRSSMVASNALVASASSVERSTTSMCGPSALFASRSSFTAASSPDSLICV